MKPHKVAVLCAVLLGYFSQETHVVFHRLRAHKLLPYSGVLGKYCRYTRTSALGGGGDRIQAAVPAGTDEGIRQAVTRGHRIGRRAVREVSGQTQPRGWYFHPSCGLGPQLGKQKALTFRVTELLL